MKKTSTIFMTACLSLTACLCLSACTAVAATTTATTAIAVGANQSLIMGRITGIAGNDVVLAMAKEGTATVQSSDAVSASGQTQSSRQRPSGPGGQTIPSGQAGQTQSAGQQPAATGTRGGTTTASGSGTKSSQQATVTYSLTGETLSTRIPVGVKVSTQKGTVTTFSRLAVGDVIKILMEKSDSGSLVPVAVWIVG